MPPSAGRRRTTGAFSPAKRPARWQMVSRSKRCLEFNQALADSGERTNRSWQVNKSACDLVVSHFGKSRLVNDLDPSDFAIHASGQCGVQNAGRSSGTHRIVAESGQTFFLRGCEGYHALVERVALAGCGDQPGPVPA